MIPDKVIDIHAHIFPEKIRAKAVQAIGDFYDLAMHGLGSGNNLIENGRKIHTVKYVVHSAATVPRQVPAINDFLAAEMAAHPEFIGFATLHPALDGLAEEIARVRELGFSGIKIHPDFQAFNMDSDEAIAMYRLIDDRWPILFHMGDATRDFSAPRRLARLAEMFPQKIFIGAHFSGHDDIAGAKEFILGKADVFIDTSSSLYALEPEEAVELLRRHGTKRAFFGTDYPMWLHEDELARFMALPLTDEEREDILWRNFARLMQLEI